MGLMLGACSNEDAPKGPDTPEVPEPVYELTELSFSDAELQAAKKMADFNIGFFRELAASQPSGKNVIGSPLSAQILLSMLANATDGTARQEIVDALGCNDLTVANSLSNKYLTKMPHSQEDVVMALANSVWYSNKYAINPTFESSLNDYFNTASKARDFSNGQLVVDEINQWCADNTNNLISEIMKQLPANAVSVLANAMYFKAAWVNPFKEEDTSEGEFHGLNGKSKVDMMHQKRYLEYAKGDNWTAVQKEYTANYAYNVWFVLPDEGVSTDEVLSALKLSDVTSGAQIKLVDFTLPKFDFATENLSLTAALNKLGIREIFKYSNDFTMFTVPLNGDLSVFQKSTIDFNEKGAEASSVTWSSFATSNGEDDTKPDVKVVTLDRPFLFFISERQSGACLMAGKIVNL